MTGGTGLVETDFVEEGGLTGASVIGAGLLLESDSVTGFSAWAGLSGSMLLVLSRLAASVREGSSDDRC